MYITFRRAALTCLVLILFSSSVGCDSSNSDDASDTSALIGTYDLKSIRDKTGEEFDPMIAGETLPTNTLIEFELSEGGIDFILGIYIEGSMTLSTSSYSITLNITFEIDRANAQNEVTTEYGTYTVNGNTLTLTSSDPDSEGPESFTYTLVGDTLTVENADVVAVFTKK